MTLLEEIERRLATVRRQRLDGWIDRADELDGLLAFAIAIEARSDETRSGSAEGESAAIAQNPA